jgi:alkanesulfonate monooxygenase SsuD/methylene tetrahydromethanopterin reductase-like flavin-dependent oxidoreductase (luciferase family)
VSPAPDPMQFAVFDHVAHKNTMPVSQRLDEFQAQAKLSDDLGFDYYFTTEHHFSGDFSLSPSQSVTLAVLAQCTERIRFGPMVSIVPVAQPLRMVEEFLILDHMSKGRLEIGLGRGITAHEHLTYGVQPDDSAAMFAEGLEFILKAMTTEGRFSWNGQFYKYFDVDIPWSPFQKPRPPVWLPTSTPATAKNAGRRGFGMGGFGLLGAAAYRPVFEAYNEGWAESGLPVEDRKISWLVPTVVADTDSEARALAYGNFSHQMSLFEYESAQSGRVVTSVAQKERNANSRKRLRAMREDPEWAESQGYLICGSPDTVAAKIQALQADLGVNVFIGEFNIGLIDFGDAMHSLRLFAEHVIPAFSSVPQTVSV